MKQQKQPKPVRIPYTEQLKTPEWSAKRLTIFRRDNFKCQTCGSKKGIQAHHIKYLRGKMAWEVPDNYLETLCTKCHMEVHQLSPIESFVIKKKQPRKFKPLSKKEKGAKRINKLLAGLSKKDRLIQKRYDKIRAA